MRLRFAGRPEANTFVTKFLSGWQAAEKFIAYSSGDQRLLVRSGLELSEALSTDKYPFRSVAGSAAALG
jgi:hypothetical protein